MSEVYYRIFFTVDGIFTVVGMQDFDEDDYDQNRFLNTATYPTEASASRALNRIVKRDFIDPEYRDDNIFTPMLIDPSVRE